MVFVSDHGHGRMLWVYVEVPRETPRRYVPLLLGAALREQRSSFRKADSPGEHVGARPHHIEGLYRGSILVPDLPKPEAHLSQRLRRPTIRVGLRWLTDQKTRAHTGQEPHRTFCGCRRSRKASCSDHRSRPPEPVCSSEVFGAAPLHEDARADPKPIDGPVEKLRSALCRIDQDDS